MDERKSRFDILWKIVRGICWGAALAIILFVAFFWFRIKSDAHMALRSAKNARMAIETIGIEFYGSDRSVYSDSSPDGMNRGVKEKVNRLVGTEGEILLQGYDMIENRVLKMRYTEEHYIVNFTTEEDGSERWRISYLLDIDLF